MAKPIRRSLLIHSVQYLEYIGEDETYGGASYGAPITLERVRVEPTKVFEKSSTGESVVMQTILFHDAVHSTPVNFKEKSKIIFNGKEMIVTKISSFYDATKLHHHEVLLQ